MGFSQEQKGRSHTRLLEVAARRVREEGFEGLAIDPLMKEAGLTKGAFYAHFPSRDALLVEATREARKSGDAALDALVINGKHPSFKRVIEAYLGWEHISNVGIGCALCALAGEAKSAPRAVRSELTANFRAKVDFIAQSIGGPHAEEQAQAVMSTLIGAVSAARAIEDETLAKSVLEHTRRMLLRSVSVAARR